MSPNRDPALLAAEILSAAIDNLDSAIKSRNAATIAAAERRIEVAEIAFADALPATPAGLRRKVLAVTSLLDVCAAGDSLTPEGAAYIRRHVESLAAGITKPRLAA